jgi:hypothetical protein
MLLRVHAVDTLTQDLNGEGRGCGWELSAAGGHATEGSAMVAHSLAGWEPADVASALKHVAACGRFPHARSKSGGCEWGWGSEWVIDEGWECEWAIERQ